MKMLSKLALAAAIFASTFAAKAEWVSGYVRSSGTYVQPYYRTPANGTVVAPAQAASASTKSMPASDPTTRRGAR